VAPSSSRPRACDPNDPSSVHKNDYCTNGVGRCIYEGPGPTPAVVPEYCNTHS
jgi:hypothetical protein